MFWIKSGAMPKTGYIYIQLESTAWKVSNSFSGPNTGKYGPEKTPYLDTFHALKLCYFTSLL